MAQLRNGAQLRRYDLEDRLLQARVDAQEMQNLVVAGQLISREAVELAIGDIIARARMILLSLPGKLGTELAAIQDPTPDKFIAVTRREIIAVLQILSRQESEEADRIMRAVQAGMERGVNAGDDGRSDRPAEDERGNPEPPSESADAADAPGEDRGRGADRPSNGGLWATLAAQRPQEPDSDPGKPARRRRSTVGSTR